MGKGMGSGQVGMPMGNTMKAIGRKIEDVGMGTLNFPKANHILVNGSKANLRTRESLKPSSPSTKVISSNLSARARAYKNSPTATPTRATSPIICPLTWAPIPGKKA